MLKKLLSLGRLLFNFAQELQQNRADIKELQREVRDLVLVVQRLAHEFERLREYESHEREKIVLRLENQILKFERRLSDSDQKNRRE